MIDFASIAFGFIGGFVIGGGSVGLVFYGFGLASISAPSTITTDEITKRSWETNLTEQKK